MRIEIPVRFTGVVQVNVPDTIPEDQRVILAEHYALSKVLATTENPDAPDDFACQQYAEEFGLPEETAEQHYDKVTAGGVSGTWSRGE